MSNINALLWSTAVGLTMFAGALLSLFKGESRDKANLKAFISGVMLYTAYIEVIPHAKEYFDNQILLSTIFLGVGIILAIMIDKYAPHFHDEDIDCHSYRLGIIAFVAISIHNLIEGASLFTITSESALSGVAYGIGIIAHNLPIGFMLTVNLMTSNKNKIKNLAIALSASIMTTIGAAIGLTLSSLNTPEILGAMLSISAGMMIHSSIDTLIDSSDGHNSHKILYRVVGGTLFIGIILALSGHSH